MNESVRLSKRVAQIKGCSRREAELYIEGGWVTVDGVVVELPQARVSSECVELSSDASLMALTPVTLLLHKPADVDLDLCGLSAQSWFSAEHWNADPQSGLKPLQRHFKDQVLMTPLASLASGLVVFTQDWRIARKLREDALLLEREVLVEVSGTAAPGSLERLNRLDHGLAMDGQALGVCKVSWQSENKLRFALKGERPGQIAYLCHWMGLQVQGMRRLRIGRVSMGRLAPGEWRYLLPHERF